MIAEDMKIIKRFILIDDDSISNFLSKFLINKAGHADVLIMTKPEKALNYIEAVYSNMETSFPTVILLELNTATMTGWQFLDFFSKFSEKIKQQFTIHILSSSIHEQDKDRALSSPLITEYIEKPITLETAKRIFANEKILEKRNVNPTGIHATLTPYSQTEL